MLTTISQKMSAVIKSLKRPKHWLRKIKGTYHFDDPLDRGFEFILCVFQVNKFRLQRENLLIQTNNG